MAAGTHPGGGDVLGERKAHRTPERVSHRILWMRVLRGLGIGAGVFALFLLSLVGGIVIHMSTPLARRMAAAQVNTILATSFQGKIRIDRLGGLGLFGIHGTDATIFDPAGQPVLEIRGVRVRIATVAAARSALFGKRGPMDVSIGMVSADHLDVRLDTDPAGKLELLNALEPKTPSRPADPNARGMRLLLPRIAISNAWAHGQMAGAPPLDVHLDDFVGALTNAPDVLEGDISGVKVDARGIANGLDVTGVLRAHVEKPADLKALVARLDWQGAVGSSKHSLVASIDKGNVSAVLEVPEAAAADVRSLFPGSALSKPAAVRFDAHGTLPSIDVALDAALGAATFHANGNVSIGDDKKALIALEGHALDVHEFAVSAPASRLGLRGNIAATRKADGALDGDVALHFLGGSVGANRAPGAMIRASVARTGPNDLRGEAEIVVEEPSAPTHLTAKLSPEGSSSVVRFALDSSVPDFDRVPELNHALRGSLRLGVTGSFDVGRVTIDASVHAAGTAIGEGTTSVQDAAISARAHGAVVDPRIDVALHAKNVAAGRVRFKSLDVAATGRAKAPHLVISGRGTDTANIDASADVALEGGLAIASMHAALERAGERAVITADRVSVAGGVTRISGMRIEGVGEPVTLTLTAAPAGLRVRASSGGVDLARVGRLAHIEKSLQRGTLSMDADMDLRRNDAFGRGAFELTGADAAGIKGLACRVEMKLDGRRFAGKIHAQAVDIGSMDIETPSLALGGAGPLSVSAWREAWGDVSFDAHADLARIAAAIPPDQLPFAEAGGIVTFKGHVKRDDLRDPTPDLTLSIITDHLLLTPKTTATRDIDGVYVMPPPAWRLAGVDFNVDGSVDGDTGDVKLGTKLHDVKGELAQVNASATRFPVGDILHGNGRLAGDLRNVPFDVRVSVPERGLGGLPDILKQNYVSGRLRAELTASGTVLSPKLHLGATIRQSRVAGTMRSVPIEFEVAADYDGSHAKANVKAEAGGHQLLNAEANIDAVLSQYLADRGSPASWQGSVRAHLTGFPLDAITILDDKVVAGQLSGDLSVVDLHKNAHADVALSVDALSVGTVRYKSASIQAKADGRAVDTAIRIEQGDGFAETKAHAAATWGAAIAPALDSAQPLDFALSAKNFRIGGMLPLVDRWLDELDGRLDADTHGQLDPRSRAATLAGGIALKKGVLEAASGGGEFHDIDASLRFAPDGAITLEKLTASGMTGRVEATGAARLRGTSLEGARVIVVIPSDAALPLSTGGAEIGNIDGRIEVTELAAEGGAMNVKVEVPHLRVALPEGSTGNAQALGEIPNVRIGAHRGHPLKFVLVPLDPVQPPESTSATKSATPITIHTNLADVQVVRGTQLKVDLSGGVDVKTAPATSVTGQIHLHEGGVLAVQGKNFTVESGTVSFVGDDPSNPQVMVKAGWKAPDGTTVYANFVGPLKTGKVTLTSEPPLSQEEIVELLIFGTAGGPQARSPSGDPQTSALGTVGGEAAQPLNHALNQLGLGAVTTKVDTTDSSAPRPEVAVQIARDISIQIAVVLGQPPPGVNPDHTLLTIDWRFLSKWSLSSTLGDAGTTIFDVLWQNRY